MESSTRILIVDDNPAIHSDFRKVLAPARPKISTLEQALFEDVPEPAVGTAFLIDSAFQGKDALAQVLSSRDEARPYALAFVDVRMPPGWDGIETIERLWEVDPDLQVVLCSAYSDYSGSELRTRFDAADGLLILRKPFDPLEVTQIAHALSRKWALHRAQKLQTEQLSSLVEARTADLHSAMRQLKGEIEDRERLERALRLAQKLEAIGQLAAGIAHEINTPTQYVTDNIVFLHEAFAELGELWDLLRETCGKGVTASVEQIERIEALEESIGASFLRAEMPRAFESAREGLDRIARIVRSMKEFGRDDRGRAAPVDINRALLTTLEVGRSTYRDVADVETELRELPPVVCVGSEINQVLLNLVVNAAHAIEDANAGNGGRGGIHVSSDVENDQVTVRIRDTGCGIPDAVRERIFDPFFTTKDIGRGTGQGLSICHAIVSRHEGTITFETEVGLGTTFIVRLPIAGKSAPA
jgi:two-component system, NtrC family, sensor kinase